MSRTDGNVEIVCGSMFSGKTEELIRRVRRAMIAKKKVQVFKPEIDTRYDKEKVISHNGEEIQAVPIPVNEAVSILDQVDADTAVVAIDEVQFFDERVVDVCEALAEQGKRVICAGLDQDFRGDPFGVAIPSLMARAEDVMKLHAICVVCGEEASRTQRLINGEPAAADDPVVLVGAAEVYEARCRGCHVVVASRNGGV